MILGVNLAADQPRLAAAEGRDYSARSERRVDRGAGDRQRAQPLPRISLLHTEAGGSYRTRPPDIGFAAYAPQSRACGRPAAVAARGPALASRAVADARLVETVHAVAAAPTPRPGRDPDDPSLSVAQLQRRTDLPAVPDDRAPPLGLRDVQARRRVRPWVKSSPMRTRASLRVDELHPSRAAAGRASATGSQARCGSPTRCSRSPPSGSTGCDLHTLPNAPYELFTFE